MLVYCEYDKHHAGSQAYLEALRSELIEFYGGPRDGEDMLYSGVIYRIPGHTDGAYCFDGEVYHWIANAHSAHCE